MIKKVPRVKTIFVDGSRELNTKINVREGDACKLVILIVGSDSDNINILATMEHSSSYSSSEIIVRGALAGSAKCQVKGLIKMNKHITNSSGLFSQRMLLLSEKAETKVFPYLQICSQNVQVKHEVAVSRLDNEQLFYLKSWGIAEKEASRMIAAGLFSKEQKLLTPVLQKKLLRRLQAVI